MTALQQKEYKYGFVSNVTSDSLPKGLNEGIIEQISAKKQEPSWVLDLRLKAYKYWQTMKEPSWAKLNYPPLNYQDMCYYSAPVKKKKLSSLDEVDSELLETFEKLGIPLSEQKRLSGVAVDAVFDSVSIATTHQETLKKHGVIFCSISEAIQNHPDLVKKYLCSVVPYKDNFFCLFEHSCFYGWIFFVLYLKGCAVLWISLLISESIKGKPASLKGLWLWQRRALL